MSKEAAEEILGLPSRYTKADLRRAYTKLARRYHPDAAAKQHLDPAMAQRLMVEANQANDVLKRQFDRRPRAVIERGVSSADVSGTGGGRPNFYDVYANENVWESSEGWSSEPVQGRPPLSVRSVLLGPVVLRVLLTVLFAWIWWQTFPLLGHNQGRYFPDGAWTLMDVAHLVAGVVYPSYLLLYEGVSGLISGFIREVLNGLVSWLSGRYVDLRPHSSSYGCALYKLLREQVYALILAPIALYLAALCMGAENTVAKVAFGLVAGLLAFDTLAAFVHGGLINVWTSALAERVEAAYLLIRRRILSRCGIE